MNRIIRSGLTFALAGACITLMSSLAQAREAVVTLKDGKQISGDMVGEDENSVTLVIATIRTPIKRDTIQDITYTKSIEDEYLERKAKLANDKPDDWFTLAEWVYHAKNLGLAKKAANEVITKYASDPKGANAIRSSKLLLKLIDVDMAKAAADAAAAPAPIKPNSSSDTTVGNNPYMAKKTDAGSKSASATDRMNEDQINTLRLLLVDPAEQPKVRIKREAIDRIFTDYSNSQDVPKGTDAQNAFRNAPGWAQLDLIFKLKARALWPQITIIDDPKVVKDFRTNVHHQYVLNYCGTALCHGGANSDLMFSNIDPASNKTVYTNFYVLSTHVDKNSSAGLIDFNSADASLLLQYGLPANIAATPHPAVKGWRPSFNATYKTDNRYLTVLEWVNGVHGPRWNDTDMSMIGFKAPSGRMGATTQPVAVDSVKTPAVAGPVVPAKPTK